MEDLGADAIESRNPNEIHFRTVCHGGDSHKLYFYLDSSSDENNADVDFSGVDFSQFDFS